MSLDAIQKRLEQHFAALRVARRASRMPVFAIEHGIHAAERHSLEARLREQLRLTGYRPSRHWLVWSIYACELAYADDGIDYWRRFESNMPGWNPNWRNNLRHWFEEFATQFDGYRPLGRWAETYPIISWPLCHALLPRDLQWQLGRTLFEFRDELVGLTRLRPFALGELVQRKNRGGSSRFENWTEQFALVGLVVQSMASGPDGSLLCSATISRIVSDVRSDRMALHWFEEVWKYLRPAVQVSRHRAMT